MSTVIYNSNRLIPAPFVSINKTYTKSGNGDIIGKIYSINVAGTIVAHMGSPMSDGTFWTDPGYPSNETVDADDRLAAIQRKQEAIRDLFSTEGLSFEIQSAGGQAAVRCYPRINSIDFAEDLWYERCEYTISLECDELYPEEEDTFTEYISDATEDWTIDTNEEPESLGGSVTYTLSHNVSAVGKKFFDETSTQPKEAWEYAKDFVLPRLGFDSVIAASPSVLNLPAYYSGWNHRRTESVDEQGGSFSVTENWVLASGSAIESFNINQQESLEAPYPIVSIQGNVQGFEERDSNMALTTTKWDNAQNKFVIASGLAYMRAKQYSGQNLNIFPLSFTIGKNPFQGTIDYTFEYDSRPINLVENAKSEVITINDNIGGQKFASVFVLGRTAGPVLQDLGTKPANTRTLNIEIVVQPPTYEDRESSTMTDLMVSQKPSNNDSFSEDLERLIAAATPTVADGYPLYYDQPQESWDFKNGRYSYNIMWTYE